MKRIGRRGSAFAVAVALSLPSGSAIGAEEKATTVASAEIGGTFISRDGNKSKQLEDNNIQSGADVALEVLHTHGDHILHVEGFGQSGERQGYLNAEFDSLGKFGFTVRAQSWREYYNSKRGGPAVTSDGVPLAFPNTYPYTNDGTDFFGEDTPSVDWLTTGLGGDYEIGGMFHDVYGDFEFRRVDGTQTLLKGGTVDDGAPQIIPGPTGQTAFVFPGSKQVDYKAYNFLAGARSGLGGINWQTDASYSHHDINSTVTEANFGTDPDRPPVALPPFLPPALVPTEFEFNDEDTKIHQVKIDVSGARHLQPNLYVYGAGFFSYEHSEPNPEQRVASTLGTTSTTTRTTSDSKVTRLTPSVSFGTVFQPTRSLLLRADIRARGSFQEGRLDEDKSGEAPFVGGDTGIARNRVDRDSAVSSVGLNADWKFNKMATMKLDFEAQHRWEDTESTRSLNYTPARAPEIEDFESERVRIKISPSIRLRMGRRWTVEPGYQFKYEDAEFDVNELSNQFILGDYERKIHRVYLKARGRIAKGLRAELRAHYTTETRTMDSPSVDIDPFALSNDAGEVEWESWSVVPMLFYSPARDWSMNASFSVGRSQLSIIDSPAFPGKSIGGATAFPQAVSYEYNTLTESLTAGASYSPSEAWSASASYTFYHNGGSVGNIGHNASFGGEYRFLDRWKVAARYRYLSYELDNAPDADDYTANVVTLLVGGTF